MVSPHAAADEMEKGISNSRNAADENPTEELFSPTASHTDTQPTLVNGISVFSVDKYIKAAKRVE